MKTMILMAMTVATVAGAQGKDLRGAYLYGAQLERVDLRGANLHKTQLAHANLKNADLRGAKLSGAYLYRADLSGADLRGAEFQSRFELHRVKLAGARFDSTTRLPFAESEALERGMVKLDNVESPDLPALRDTTLDGQALASR